MTTHIRPRVRRVLFALLVLLVILTIFLVVWSPPVRQASALGAIREGYGAPSVCSDASSMPPRFRHIFWPYFSEIYAINCSQVNQRKHYGPHDPPMPPFDDAWFQRVLPHMRKLHDLERLTLSDTAITDDGLPGVHTLTKLRAIDLSNTQITDDAIPELVAIPALEQIDLSQTKVTEAGLEQLRQARPSLVIHEFDFYDSVPPRLP